MLALGVLLGIAGWNGRLKLSRFSARGSSDSYKALLTPLSGLDTQRELPDAPESNTPDAVIQTSQ